jgi:hypothetical protein
MSCDEFEIAIERRARGALTPEENAALSAHLAGCESCRRFESSLSAITQSLQRHGAAEMGGIDMGQIRKKLDKEILGKRNVITKMAMLVGSMLGTHWLMAAVRSTPGPVDWLSPSISALSACVFVWWFSRQQARQAAAAIRGEQGDMLSFWRGILDKRLRTLRWMSWIAPLSVLLTVAAANLLAPGHVRRELPGLIILVILAIAATIWARVAVARTQRELASLR